MSKVQNIVLPYKHTNTPEHNSARRFVYCTADAGFNAFAKAVRQRWSFFLTDGPYAGSTLTVDAEHPESDCFNTRPEMQHPHRLLSYDAAKLCAKLQAHRMHATQMDLNTDRQ